MSVINGDYYINKLLKMGWDYTNLQLVYYICYYMLLHVTILLYMLLYIYMLLYVSVCYLICILYEPL